MVIADYQYPLRASTYMDNCMCAFRAARCAAADQFEQYAARRWQRWSWHYPSWDPALHNLRTHIEVFRDRLARGN
jgi:hypothetical protein